MLRPALIPVFGLMVGVAGAAEAEPRLQAGETSAGDTWTEPPAAAPTEPPETARAGDGPALVVFERARADYQAARYSPCSDLLTQLFERTDGSGILDPGIRDEARHYAFACALLSGDPDLAEHHADAALRKNPAMEDPDPIVFRPNVVERFIEIRVAGREARRESAQARVKVEEAASKRREVLARERAGHLEELKALARQERVVQRNERWMAMVPFGVGQFQNRSDALGWFFLTSELLFAGTLATATIIELDQHAQIGQNSTPERTAQATRILASAQTAEIVGGWGLLAMAFIGIVEAQLSFVPEFEDAPRARELPEHLENLEATDRPGVDWRPTFRAGEDGGEIGVVLSF